MWQQILPGLRIKLFMTVLLGVIYPLAMTGLAQVFFPHQANGSLITSGDKVIGSELIGQNFTKPEYFQPRPSAAGNDGYDPTASGGSNYGPTSQKLVDRVKASIDKFRKENPDYTGPLPADLVTASASGLDPHLSPDSAGAEAARVAKARGMSPEQIDALIAQFTEGPDLGFLGEPRVNVLKLNLALDARFPPEMSALTAFGLFAVTAMLICYALEKRGPAFILAFAGSCLLGSAYGFLQGAWPFGLVEGVWSVVALRRWWLARGMVSFKGGTDPNPELQAKRSPGGSEDREKIVRG